MHGTMKKHPTRAQRQECVSLYSEGALRKQLAILYRVHETTIGQWIMKAGAQRRRTPIAGILPVSDRYSAVVGTAND